jgi:hypothetical protein
MWSFTNETFTQQTMKGILFGDYSMLIQQQNPYILCYVFKGQQYYAQKKLSLLVQRIMKNNTLKQALKEKIQTDKALGAKMEGLIEQFVKLTILTAEGENA